MSSPLLFVGLPRQSEQEHNADFVILIPHRFVKHADGEHQLVSGVLHAVRDGDRVVKDHRALLLAAANAVVEALVHLAVTGQTAAICATAAS